MSEFGGVVRCSHHCEVRLGEKCTRGCFCCHLEHADYVCVELSFGAEEVTNGVDGMFCRVLLQAQGITIRHHEMAFNCRCQDIARTTSVAPLMK